MARDSLGLGEEETEFYAQAEALRQTLLQPYENVVERAQVVLQKQLAARDTDGALDVREMETGFNKHGKGLRAIQTFEDAATTSDILNGYAELIYQYREMIIQMMLTRVSIAGASPLSHPSFADSRLTVPTAYRGQCHRRGVRGARGAAGEAQRLP